MSRTGEFQPNVFPVSDDVQWRAVQLCTGYDVYRVTRHDGDAKWVADLASGRKRFGSLHARANALSYARERARDEIARAAVAA